MDRINIPLGFSPFIRLNHLHIFKQKEGKEVNIKISHQLPIIDPEFYVQVAEEIKVSFTIHLLIFRIIQKKNLH